MTKTRRVLKKRRARVEAEVARYERDRMQVRGPRSVSEDRRKILGERIRVARESHKQTQNDLAAELWERFSIKVTQGMVSLWEGGKTWPNADDLVRLSEYFAIPVGELLGVEERSTGERAGVLSVAVVGEICAGRGNRATEDVRIEDVKRGHVRQVQDVVTRRMQGMLRAPNHEIVALTVSGDSMETVFRDGDLILVERLAALEELRDRDYVVATLDGDGSWVLRLWIEEARILSPLNLDRFDPAYVREETKVWGRVVYVMRAMGR